MTDHYIRSISEFIGLQIDLFMEEYALVWYLRDCGLTRDEATAIAGQSIYEANRMG